MKVPSKFHPQRRFTYRGNYLTFNHVYRLKSDLSLARTEIKENSLLFGQFYCRMTLLEKRIET